MCVAFVESFFTQINIYVLKSFKENEQTLFSHPKQLKHHTRQYNLKILKLYIFILKHAHMKPKQHLIQVWDPLTPLSVKYLTICRAFLSSRRPVRMVVDQLAAVV